MTEKPPESTTEALGSTVLQLAFGVYFSIGGIYGEWRVFSELGCMALHPFSQVLVAWYAVTWPFQVLF